MDKKDRLQAAKVIVDDLLKKEGIVNSALRPDEQAELLAIFLKRLRPRNALQAELVWGRVLINDPQIPPSAQMRWTPECDCYFLPLHFWVKARINKVDVIIDITLQDVVNQQHESIPYGVFTIGELERFRYREGGIMNIRASEERMNELMNKTHELEEI